MSGKIKILVAEDDLNIREGLCDALELEAYDVREAVDGSDALKQYTQWQPDLILLDIMMPKVSGYDVCRQIRNGNPDIPIIMLTAKGEEIDKVLGLELGADDYVTKPFSLRELMARVSAVMRRTQRGNNEERKSEDNGEFKFGDVTVNSGTMQAHTPAGSHDLSSREIDLLKFFVAHSGQVLDRNKILSAVWGSGYGGYSRTLDQHIAQLRKKIEPDPAKPVYIETVYGIGYRFRG